MNKTHIFPLILIACNLGAAVTYAASRDVRKVIHWIAAAALNAVVTFKKKKESFYREKS